MDEELNNGKNVSKLHIFNLVVLKIILPLVIAFIGYYATTAYKEREIAISQVGLVKEFMDRFESNDEQAKEAALLAISSLGNTRLAIDLAASYRTKGSIFALSRIASNADEKNAKMSMFVLARTLIDIDPDIRKTTEEAINRIDNPKLIPILINMLEEQDWVFRFFSLKVLSRIGNEKVIPHINQIKDKDKSKIVLDEANIALEKIKTSTTTARAIFYCDNSNCPGHESPLAFCQNSINSDEKYSSERTQKKKVIQQSAIQQQANRTTSQKVYYCSKPGCPGHQLPSDKCAYYCSKPGCPGHSSPSDRCAYYCTNPNCPGHSSPNDRCR